jgi:hypothetical protein
MPPLLSPAQELGATDVSHRGDGSFCLDVHKMSYIEKHLPRAHMIQCLSGGIDLIIKLGIRERDTPLIDEIADIGEEAFAEFHTKEACVLIGIQLS